MSSYEKKLTKYAEHNLNVLITGTHGIGKSTIVKNIAKKMNLKFGYYSASTLDPWADIVGIPKPVDEDGKRYLDFYRPRDLETAEFIMFDELNRAHPRVLNAVLEIIQFKSVNGNPLPNLKMVWAAINPPGQNYQVEDLDPALLDRFHVFFKMNAMIDVEYLSTIMDPSLAKTLRNWWQDDLTKELKELLTPRRIEYIGRMIEMKLQWKDALPPGHVFPRQCLDRRLRILNGEEKDFILNKKNIIENEKSLIKRLKTQPDCAIKIAQQMIKFSDDQLFTCRNLLESLTKELVLNLGNMKFPGRKKSFRYKFEEAKIDYLKDYPKISAAYNFKDI